MPCAMPPCDLAVGDHRVDDEARHPRPRRTARSALRRSRHRPRPSPHGRHWSRCPAGRRWRRPSARSPRGSRSGGSCDRRPAPARRSATWPPPGTRASPSARTIAGAVGLEERRRRSTRSFAASFSAASLQAPPADDHRAAGEGAPAIGRRVGVAVDDADRLRREAEARRRRAGGAPAAGPGRAARRRS